MWAPGGGGAGEGRVSGSGAPQGGAPSPPPAPDPAAPYRADPKPSCPGTLAMFWNLARPTSAPPPTMAPAVVRLVHQEGCQKLSSNTHQLHLHRRLWVQARVPAQALPPHGRASPPCRRLNQLRLLERRRRRGWWRPPARRCHLWLRSQPQGRSLPPPAPLAARFHAGRTVPSTAPSAAAARPSCPKAERPGPPRCHYPPRRHPARPPPAVPLQARTRAAAPCRQRLALVVPLPPSPDPHGGLPRPPAVLPLLPCGWPHPRQRRPSGASAAGTPCPWASAPPAAAGGRAACAMAQPGGCRAAGKGGLG